MTGIGRYEQVVSLVRFENEAERMQKEKTAGTEEKMRKRKITTLKKKFFLFFFFFIFFFFQHFQ